MNTGINSLPHDELHSPPWALATGHKDQVSEDTRNHSVEADSPSIAPGGHRNAPKGNEHDSG